MACQVGIFAHTGWDEIDGTSKICTCGFFTLWFCILINSDVGVAMRLKMTRRKTRPKYHQNRPTRTHREKKLSLIFAPLRPKANKMARTYILVST